MRKLYILLIMLVTARITVYGGSSLESVVSPTNWVGEDWSVVNAFSVGYNFGSISTVTTSTPTYFTNIFSSTNIFLPKMVGISIEHSHRLSWANGTAYVHFVIGSETSNVKEAVPSGDYTRLLLGGSNDTWGLSLTNLNTTASNMYFSYEIIADPTDPGGFSPNVIVSRYPFNGGTDDGAVVILYMEDWNRNINVTGDLGFGTALIDTSSNLTMTIESTGDGTLTITNISYPTAFSGAWTGEILGGSSTNVTVTFAPTNAQVYGGTITVYSDATSGTNTIECAGTGRNIIYTPVIRASSITSIKGSSITSIRGTLTEE